MTIYLEQKESKARKIIVFLVESQKEYTLFLFQYKLDDCFSHFRVCYDTPENYTFISNDR